MFVFKSKIISMELVGLFSEKWTEHNTKVLRKIMTANK